MKYKRHLKFLNLLFVLPLIAMVSSISCSARTLYIRVNQTGFLNDDIKTAVVFTNDAVNDPLFSVINTVTRKTVFTGKLQNSTVTQEGYRHLYTADFSSLELSGKYVLEVKGGGRSREFSIGRMVYNGVADSLLRFFRAQRCGYTSPILHGVCHPDDAVRLIEENGGIINKKVDVTGGWHDAGDYIKFFNTTAFVTYTLMFAYEFDNRKFGFDNDKNGVPDVLEEAKIGLDWLLRANYQNRKFITQVQDLRDHDQGWRLPENDPLAADRLAYLGSGKNLTGIYTAVMAMASRIWRETIKYPEFADYCLNAAENAYSYKDNVKDVDNSGTGEYRDISYYSKLALGAAELYRSTNRQEFLADAAKYADKAGSDYWWSWADIGAYVHFRLAEYEPRFRDYLKNNLEHFRNKMKTDPFGRAVDNMWGSNNAALGAALQAILWKRLTESSEYDSLLVFQRDYILGRNPWDVSFIYGIGKNYSKELHSQIAFFNGGRLPGAMAAGPVKKEITDKQKIQLDKKNRYYPFQSAAAVYRDDRNDFLTNEPAIISNATALFVFGYFK